MSTTPWKQFKTASSWLLIKDLVRRLGVADGKDPADEMRGWLKTVSRDWVPPTSKDIIFTDLKNFQYLSPSRHVDFHRMLERIYFWSVRMAGSRPLFANNWGDAIHVIYDSPPQAAAFSLAFVEAAAEVNWRYYGLPASTNFRVGIHHGRVQMHKDRILNRNLFVGDSVTHAARLEPVASPGEVLMSKAFVDALSASDDGRFECKYVGNKYLSKAEREYPAFGLYRKEPVPAVATP